MSRAVSQYRQHIRGLAVPLILLILAELSLRMSAIQSDTFARPTAVVAALLEVVSDGSLLQATAQTLGAAMGGLLIGAGLGLVVGLWFGLSRLSARLGALTVQLLMPVPSVALIPLAMLIFGFGYQMEILVVTFTCFFPMLILTRNAVANVEPRLLELAKVISLGPLQQCWKIILPAAMPRIFVAFRLAAGIALVVSITVEITTNPYGLGYAMMSAQQTLQPALMLAFLSWIGVLGWAINAGFLQLQKRLFNPLVLSELT